MNRKNILLVVCVMITCASICISCKSLPELNLTERDLILSMEHDGYRRTYIMHLPKNHDQRTGLPVVMALHGGGGTAKGMIRLTQGRFNDLADTYGFLVIYPQGLNKSWNDGRNDPISYAHKNNIDDIGFLNTIIDTVINKYKADPGKIYVTGISNGGFMCFRVSRELAHRIKGIAPVTATIPYSTKNDHLSAPAMNILLLNGTADPLVPYNGGYVQVLGKKRGKILSTDQTIKIFVQRNNCSAIPKISQYDNRDPDDGTRVIRYEYMNDVTGNTVVLLEVVDGGHTWPGGWQYLGRKLIGKTSMDINACDEIWQFFRSVQ